MAKQSAVESALNILSNTKERKDYTKRVLVPLATFYPEEKRLARRNLEQDKLRTIRQAERKADQGKTTNLHPISEIIGRQGFKYNSPHNQYYFRYTYVYKPVASTFEREHFDEYKKTAKPIEFALRSLVGPVRWTNIKLLNQKVVPQELIKEEFFSPVSGELKTKGREK